MSASLTDPQLMAEFMSVSAPPTHPCRGELSLLQALITVPTGYTSLRHVFRLSEDRDLLWPVHLPRAEHMCPDSRNVKTVYSTKRYLPPSPLLVFPTCVRRYEVPKMVSMIKGLTLADQQVWMEFHLCLTQSS